MAGGGGGGGGADKGSNTCLDCSKGTSGTCQNTTTFECGSPLPGTAICPSDMSVCPVNGCVTTVPGKQCSNNGFCDSDGDCRCHTGKFGKSCDTLVIKSGFTVAFRDTRTGGYLESGPDGWLYLREKLPKGKLVPRDGLFRVYTNELTMDFIKFGDDLLLQSLVTGNILRQLHRYVTVAVGGMPSEFDPEAVFVLSPGHEGASSSKEGIISDSEVSIRMFDGELAGSGENGLVVCDTADKPFVMEIHDATQHILQPNMVPTASPI